MGLIEIPYDELPDTIAVVGSRSFARSKQSDEYIRRQVSLFVSKTRPETRIVSGGAIGVDDYAEYAADEHVRTFVPILPKKELGSPWMFFERNGRLVDYVKKHDGMIVAFIDVANWNGTRRTLNLAETRDVPYVKLKFQRQPIRFLGLDKSGIVW